MKETGRNSARGCPASWRYIGRLNRAASSRPRPIRAAARRRGSPGRNIQRSNRRSGPRGPLFARIYERLRTQGGGTVPGAGQHSPRQSVEADGHDVWPDATGRGEPGSAHRLLLGGSERFEAWHDQREPLVSAGKIREPERRLASGRADGVRDPGDPLLRPEPAEEPESGERKQFDPEDRTRHEQAEEDPDEQSRPPRNLIDVAGSVRHRELVTHRFIQAGGARRTVQRSPPGPARSRGAPGSAEPKPASGASRARPLPADAGATR